MATNYSDFFITKRYYVAIFYNYFFFAANTKLGVEYFLKLVSTYQWKKDMSDMGKEELFSNHFYQY